MSVLRGSSVIRNFALRCHKFLKKTKQKAKMPEENGNNKRIRNEIQRFKLVVVGDGACGKTSILTKFTVRRDLLIFIFTKSKPIP